MSILNKCFISAPFGFDASAITHVLEEAGVLGVRLDNLFAGRDVSGELYRAMSECDFVCGVFSSDLPSLTVLFEIGLARGLNRPILILSDERFELPFELGTFEIARINLKDPAAIRLHLIALMRNLENRRTPSGEQYATRLSPVDVSVLRETVGKLETTAGDPKALFASNAEPEIAQVLADCFQKAGAMASVAHEHDRVGADLGIWVDALQTVIGNPILIELKIGRLDTDEITRAEHRLRSALKGAGAFAGLLVYLDADRKSFVQNVGTFPLVFYFSIYEIMASLQDGTFVRSVTERRNRAFHGRT